MLNFCYWTAYHSKCQHAFGLWKSIRYIHDDVRVRFAPSPTGFLHLGGLRTALYNYLFAASCNNGKFVLRIEDTDKARVVPGALESLLSTLQWSGLSPDEGPSYGGNYGPYLQSERLHHYNKHAEELVRNGSAYRCFCSQQRLYLLKKDQLRRREAPKYDNRCRHIRDEELQENLHLGKPYVVRLKVDVASHEIKDDLFGHVSHHVGLEGDPVLLKSDGFPTYHLANVVDDHLMEITHVIRGKEWLISTPKHDLLYKAFGWIPPRFMHLPLLLNPDKTKLSKRQGDVFVEEYRKKGFSPSSLINFMLFCGGGFPGIAFPVCVNDHKLLLQEISSSFDPKKLLQSDAVVDFVKLEEFSRTLSCHLLGSKSKETRKRLVDELYTLIISKYGKDCLFNDESFSTEVVANYLNVILDFRKNHIVKLSDLVADEYDYLWIRLDHQFSIDVKFHDALLGLIRYLRFLEWGEQKQREILNHFSEVAKTHNIKFPTFMKLIRKILSGKLQGPKVVDMMLMLGKSETLWRLEAACQQPLRSTESNTDKVT